MTTVTIVAKQRPRGSAWDGAWAASVVCEDKRHTTASPAPNATQQEAIMRGLLSVLENCSAARPIEVRSNFKNLIEGANRHTNEWRKTRWKTQANTEVLYEDLWRAIAIESRRYPITWTLAPSNDDEIIQLSEACAQIL